MGWRLPQHCAQGLGMAASALRVNPSRDFWAHDLLQAGTVALWQREPDTKWLAYTVAKRAMTDELRKLTPGQRQNTDAPVTLVPIVFNSYDAARTPVCDDQQFSAGGWIDPRLDGCNPESYLQAAQTLAAMEALAPGWAEALALSDGLAAAGRRLGVSESRACQVRRWLQVSCA